MSDQNKITNFDRRGILIHLDPNDADKFYALARSKQFYDKKSPTALAKELIIQFLESNKNISTITEK